MVRYDIIVIGSGPGEEGAAMQAVKNGKTVAIIVCEIDTTFNYPTMAEAYRVAALNGLNRLF